MVVCNALLNIRGPLLFAGKEVSKFCAKFLHQQMLADEAYVNGDLGTSIRKAFLRLFIFFFLFVC